MENKEISVIPTLETERLILRELKTNDVENIFEYASIPEVAEYVQWYPHKTKEDSLGFINFALEQFFTGASLIWGIVLKSENKLIGSIDLRDWKSDNKCSDTGYVISKNYWNKGFVSEALRAVINFAFEELHLNRIEAHCEEENKGSWHVMEKCGMKYEGTLREKVFIKGRFRTMKVYSILQKEWKAK